MHMMNVELMMQKNNVKWQKKFYSVLFLLLPAKIVFIFGISIIVFLTLDTGRRTMRIGSVEVNDYYRTLQESNR
jgi:hypothetical protein